MMSQVHGNLVTRSLVVAFLVGLGGCSSGGSTSGAAGLDPESIRARSDMYSLYLATHKFQPPKNEAEFRQFLSSEQARLDKAGLTVDDMFVSPRNGEPITWIFSKSPPNAGGISVFAYESKSTDGQRLLVGNRGMYVLVDDAQFNRSFPNGT